MRISVARPRNDKKGNNAEVRISLLQSDSLLRTK